MTAMTLDEPFCYDLAVSEGAYRVLREGKSAKFCAPVSTVGVSKLYTVSAGASLLYVGIAERSMSARLAHGFRAAGEHGYHGYRWKGLNATLRLSVWTARLNGAFASILELKTIEAEVAFCCRHVSGQWPTHQLEVHFHPSDDRHRRAAEKIYDHAVAR